MVTFLGYIEFSACSTLLNSKELASALASSESKAKFVSGVKRTLISYQFLTLTLVALTVIFVWFPIIGSGGNVARRGLTNIFGLVGMFCTINFLLCFFSSVVSSRSAFGYFVNLYVSESRGTEMKVRR